MTGSQGGSSDDYALLQNLLPTQRNEGAVVAAGDSGSAKRLCLRRADYVATQMLQPHGPSAIEKAPLGALWSVVKGGNKWTEFYSYLAHPEAVRQGVAISQCAQTLKHAIAHFRESHVEHIMKQSIYVKVKQVTDEIYPHLEVLDGGYHQQGKGSGFAKLGRTITTKTEEEVEVACKAIFAWLKNRTMPFVPICRSCQEQALSIRRNARRRSCAPMSHAVTTRRRISRRPRRSAYAPMRGMRLCLRPRKTIVLCGTRSIASSEACLGGFGL